MKTFLKTFLKDESGASAAEYALILAVVGVAIGAGALVLGQNVAASVENAAETVGRCGETASEMDGEGFTEEVLGTECGDGT